MEGNTITITVEEYKDLLEAKILLQNFERKLEHTKSSYVDKGEAMDMLGMERAEEEENR